jgi:transposase InsO family protein
MDCHVTLDRENCSIVDRKTGRMLGIGIRRNGLWFLDRRIDTPCTVLTVSLGEVEAKVILEHCQLGHLSFDTMVKVFSEIMSKVDKRKLVCDACEYGKHTRSIYVSRGLRSISPFMLIHSDVWACLVISISGMKYFVTLIDCYSRITWIYLMKQKNEVLKCFQDFCSLVENQYDARVKLLRTDNGTEYVNNEFQNYLSAQGILHQTTRPDTPP